MDAPVIGRLAPSPTGALHLGNARSFLLAWLSARSQRGQVILRIEDIDSPRVKTWATDHTIETLRWLGLNWDQGPDQATGGDTPMVQTQRLPRYCEVFNQLRQLGKLYVCVCSRSEVEAAASAPHESSQTFTDAADLKAPILEGPVYPETCRELAISPENAVRFAWRWRFDDGTITWHDRLLGHQCASPRRQLGDFVIAKQDFTPAYQLAVVVDDHDMAVTEVVRGDDLVASTFRQVAILEQLNWKPPTYYHVPLMIGEDGRRLAKRHGDTRVTYFRDQGIPSEAVVGFLAWSAGLIEKLRAIRPEELITSFDWSRLIRRPTVVNHHTLLRQLRSCV